MLQRLVLFLILSAVGARPITQQQIENAAAGLRSLPSSFRSILDQTVPHLIPKWEGQDTCLKNSEAFRLTCADIDCSVVSENDFQGCRSSSAEFMKETCRVALCCKKEMVKTSATCVCDGVGSQSSGPLPALASLVGTCTDMKGDCLAGDFPCFSGTDLCMPVQLDGFTVTAATCKDADSELKQLFAGTDNGDCCDVCNDGIAGRTSQESHAFRAICTGDFQGPSVCGTDVFGNTVLNKGVYHRDECSTGPDITLVGLNEDLQSCDGDFCTGPRVCKVTKHVAMSYLHKARGINTENYEALLTSAEKDAAQFFFEFPRAYVMNGPGVVNRAAIKAKLVQEDDNGDTCAGVLIEPYFAGELDLTSGDAIISDPTVTAEGEIRATGPSSILIVGGVNAGTIDITDMTGPIEISGTKNEGPIRMRNVADVFIDSITNAGPVRVEDCAATVYDTTNTGDLFVYGGQFTVRGVANNGGKIRVTDAFVSGEVLANTGTIDLIGCTGHLSVPVGSMVNIIGGDVTVIRRDGGMPILPSPSLNCNDFSLEPVRKECFKCKEGFKPEVCPEEKYKKAKKKAKKEEKKDESSAKAIKARKKAKKLQADVKDCKKKNTKKKDKFDRDCVRYHKPIHTGTSESP